MALSNEAIIGLVGIIIMCFPLARYLLRLANRRMNGNDHRLTRAPRDLLPRYEVPDHVPGQAGMRHMELGVNLVALRRDSFVFCWTQ
ncbi:hypothetical protein F4821DRAFT_242217 [Hypoxylon rubiginosum]|uniref:Uncharacterized protein n=1 Tax=Hypoxylon rubiginosum TaxID=110542 RepID=A0ACC0CWC5_9PEZI|nr:hypothetical protein F4821DRAFT_242217 [Hypoxylon rubiginosum]